MTERSTNSALVGGYWYAAFDRLILGVQGGATLGDGRASKVAFGMGTLGYPASPITRSVVYPFIGIGSGLIRSHGNPNDRGAVFGAGVGADRVHGEGPLGLLVGLRGGYVFRRGDDGERAIYVTLALGAARRPVPPEKPPIIAARTGCSTTEPGLQ